MKRLHILFGLTLVCVTTPNVVLGGCKLFSCGAKDGVNAWLTADQSGNQCWFCGMGPNSCGSGDVVPYVDAQNNVVSLYQCNTLAGGVIGAKFSNYSPGVFCDDSELSANNINSVKITNALRTYKLKGKKTTPTNIGDWDVFTANASCIHIKCNAGYMPNANKTECIADTRQVDCEKTSGTWNDSSCTCDSNKHLKQSTDKLTCVCADGYVDASNVATKKLECVASQETIDEQNAKKCRNSGGQWQNDGCVCNSDKNLTKSGDVCVCKPGYEYKGTNKADGCKMTQATANAQDKNKCKKSQDSGQPVEWDDKAKKCYCNGVTGQYKDIRDNGTIYHCEETDNYIACKKLGSNANWHNGKCTCKDPTKQFKNGNCDTNTDEYEAQLAAEAAAIAAAQLSEKIEKIGKTLDAVTDTFEISKWRNADGEFNTARLASDSVAAVVLGTAGGLISSKVIKKKQIEDGFEDIKCIIGSQTVADYGDEFQVGIQ